MFCLFWICICPSQLAPSEFIADQRNLPHRTWHFWPWDVQRLGVHGTCKYGGLEGDFAFKPLIPGCFFCFLQRKSNPLALLKSLKGVCLAGWPFRGLAMWHAAKWTKWVVHTSIWVSRFLFIGSWSSLFSPPWMKYPSQRFIKNWCILLQKGLEWKQGSEDGDHLFQTYEHYFCGWNLFRPLYNG